MTTITKERLQWLANISGRDDIDDIDGGEIRELARIALASLEAEPVSQTYNLPELIEGMEVSIDVSTCDADLGNRYFGTVTEELELDTAKNGYILLVQDAEPNFDVNGNYPVTPDGWISCSERMPENIPGSCKEYLVFDGLNNKVHHDYWVVPDGDSAPVASFWNHYGAHVTHWMPLPEPPQEIN
ncbi:TPA: DUF551 domain-containing protein [Escherichia coli]|uniref:DUF551 domain-containing protein n=1 Tax=Escherichia coli TaxID=562 RepID=UPI00122E3548|nr:DUF551 domain-containing protein [Escherichia coli]KAA1830890.1 DUF551 domain-containing protein [Escherichia coli]HAK9389292.1 DUF551 domain-containing protein [Escherichia coli]HAM6663428.1 DUF551 domain-containing protein [Escherichia coli]